VSLVVRYTSNLPLGHNKQCEEELLSVFRAMNVSSIVTIGYVENGIYPMAEAGKCSPFI
jgi:hypothetical protein